MPQSAYNMKGCLRLSTFIFAIWPNLAKYTYGQLPFEQHHKIEKKKEKHCCAVTSEGLDVLLFPDSHSQHSINNRPVLPHCQYIIRVPVLASVHSSSVCVPRPPTLPSASRRRICTVTGAELQSSCCCCEHCCLWSSAPRSRKSVLVYLDQLSTTSLVWDWALKLSIQLVPY